MATPPSKGKLLYHITHIDNIPSILTLGLMSRKTLEQTGISFKDTADQEILNKRENYKDSLLQIVTVTGQQGHNSRPVKDLIPGQKMS